MANPGMSEAWDPRHFTRDKACAGLHSRVGSHAGCGRVEGSALRASAPPFFRDTVYPFQRRALMNVRELGIFLHVVLTSRPAPAAWHQGISDDRPCSPRPRTRSERATFRAVDTLRRFTALLAVIALAMPLTGAVPGDCKRSDGHGEMVLISQPQAADTGGGPETGHCGERDSQEPQPPSPCGGDDATQCASMSSCTFASAVIPEPPHTAIPTALTSAVIEDRARPAGVATAPEPPPPRA